MMEQFQDVLNTPRPSSALMLNKIQDKILTTMEELLPSSFDFSYLNTIYDEELGANRAQQLEQGKTIHLSIDQQINLNYRLVSYFLELVGRHFIGVHIYQALQQQTQKSESTIRSHIKVEQEMKMYMEYLEAKLHRCEKQLEESGPEQCAHFEKEIELLRSREMILYREKVNLIKKTEQLSSQLEYLNSKAFQHVQQKQLEDDRSAQQGTVQLRMRGESRPEVYQKQREYFGFLPHEYEHTQKKQSAHFPEL